MTDTQTFHDKANPMLLSYSGISDYLTCAQRWKLRYVYGLKQVTASKPMDIGSAVHAGLAHFLAMKGTAEEGVSIWVDEMIARYPHDNDGNPMIGEDDCNHIEGCANSALNILPRVLNEIQKLGLQTLFDDEGEAYVERELLVALPGWDGFASHLDWIAHDPKTGLNWYVDFKVRGTFQPESSEDVNLQNPIYQYMCAQHGIQVAGTITLQIKSKPSDLPKLTKSGAMSKALITCDWDMYKAELLRAGLDPVEYEDMRAKLGTIEWVRLTKAYRSPETVNRVWDKVVFPVSQQMRHIRNRLMSHDKTDRRTAADLTTRNMSSRTCPGCSVADVCLGALKGHDVTYQLAQFSHRGKIVTQAMSEDLL